MNEKALIRSGIVLSIITSIIFIPYLLGGIGNDIFTPEYNETNEHILEIWAKGSLLVLMIIMIVGVIFPLIKGVINYIRIGRFKMF